MNVESMTFGVEIEATIPRGTLAVGPHGHGCAIAVLPGWKADRDPSIRAGNGHEACEFVSPVYTGSAGLEQLMRDLATIKSLGAKVNNSCGLHIHIGFDKSNPEQMAKVVTLVANFEKAIFASTGTKSREQGRWCNSLQRYGSAENAQDRARFERYHVLNITTTKPTVEFRAFAATLDAVKLSAYVRMCVGLVERALRATKATDWTAKEPKASSPIHRSGEGQTAVTRLFYQLGWTKGRQPHTHGNLTGENIPSIQDAKKELMRLARKYDNPPAAPTAVSRRGAITMNARVRFNAPSHLMHDHLGTVVVLQPRRSPVVQFDNGRRYRVPRRFLVVIPATN